jgi:hypothetical protein
MEVIADMKSRCGTVGGSVKLRADGEVRVEMSGAGIAAGPTPSGKELIDCATKNWFGAGALFLTIATILGVMPITIDVKPAGEGEIGA